MADRAQRTWNIASRLEDAPSVVRDILSALAEHGYHENACFAVHLALDEAITNAIRHGNCCDPDKTVRIDLRICDQRVVIDIEDQGPGFDPEALPDPTVGENLEKPHGRGVMLMRAYMTEVSYNARGNRVTLVKERNCTLPTQA